MARPWEQNAHNRKAAAAAREFQPKTPPPNLPSFLQSRRKPLRRPRKRNRPLPWPAQSFDPPKVLPQLTASLRHRLNGKRNVHPIAIIRMLADRFLQQQLNDV